MATNDTGATAPAGLRERKKLAKLQRIRRVAREVFLEKGYDGTTTKEIAERADIAFGTLFLYAQDKVDLLLMTFEEPYAAMLDRAYARLSDNTDFVEQLVDLFTDFLEFFASSPNLSRRMLREGTFYKDSPSGEHRKQMLRQSASRLEALVVANQAAGRIGTATEARDIAELIFLIYRSDLRTFMNDDPPDLAAGLDRLRKHFGILVAGLQHDAAAG